MLYALDIETEGLDPTVERVISIAIAAEAESVVFDSSIESTLFDDLLHWLHNPARGGTLVTWNGCGFDWPYLYTRAVALGKTEFLEALTMTPSDQRRPPYKPLNGHSGGYAVQFAGYDHIDVMRPWKPWSLERGISNALKVVARANGIDVIEVDRTNMAALSRQELVAYNISDVDATLTLAKRLGSDIEQFRDSSLIPVR